MGALVSVVAALVILTVTGTPHTRIEDEARKVTLHNGLNIAHTSSYNFNTTTLQLAQCTIAHTAGEHHLDTHLLQVVGNARLATASLRRGHILA